MQLEQDENTEVGVVSLFLLFLMTTAPVLEHIFEMRGEKEEEVKRRWGDRAMPLRMQKGMG
jgi:hypothetical protein